MQLIGVKFYTIKQTKFYIYCKNIPITCHDLFAHFLSVICAR